MWILGLKGLTFYMTLCRRRRRNFSVNIWFLGVNKLSMETS